MSRIRLTKFFFVINPISGGQEKDDLVQWITDLCRENEFEYNIYFTSGDDDDDRVGKLIKEYQPQVAVASGGDGTVNLVARQILHSEIALAILPSGSGNGLAKDLNIPHLNLRSALNLLVEPFVKKIDTLEANGKFFMHICDLGFNAHVVRLFNKTKKRGLLSYMRFSVREFFKYKTFRYQITTEKDSVSGVAFMITIANSNQFGSNLTINPDGKVDDGEFEIIIIRRFPRKKTLGILFRLITKRINFSPYTRILKANKATIQTKKNKTLQYDGEIYGRVNKVEVKINPASLKVIVPKEKEKG